MAAPEASSLPPIERRRLLHFRALDSSVLRRRQGAPSAAGDPPAPKRIDQNGACCENSATSWVFVPQCFAREADVFRGHSRGHGQTWNETT